MEDKIPDLIDIEGNKILNEQDLDELFKEIGDKISQEIKIFNEQDSDELIKLLEKSKIIDAKYLIVIMSEMCHKSKLICLKN